MSGLFDLKDHIAIVTGGAGQLGGEYVRTLLEAGCRAAVFDLNLDNPKGRLLDLKQDNLLLVSVDITDRGSIEAGLRMVIAAFGHPNILVNNAAIDAPPHASRPEDTGLFEEYPEETWQAMMDVNLKGTFFCCQVVGGDMAKNGGGSIINISSIYGMLSPDQRIYEYKRQSGKLFFKPVGYSVTKSGILNLTRYLATYWAGQNVRVNTMTLAGVCNGQEEDFLSGYCQRVPLGRMARPDEYNGALVFLASSASSYMTGSNLILDGGYSCW